MAGTGGARNLPDELSALLAAGTDSDAAWGAFVAVHSRLLLHVARSFRGGRDAVMDRYAFLLEKLREEDGRRLRQFDAAGASRFTTWLVVVARRLCLDHHRHRYGRFGGPLCYLPKATYGVSCRDAFFMRGA